MPFKAGYLLHFFTVSCFEYENGLRQTVRPPSMKAFLKTIGRIPKAIGFPFILSVALF